MVERYVEFSFPVWVVTDPVLAGQEGVFATHTVSSPEGDRDLPLFTTAQKAKAYIENQPVPGGALSEIENDTDLKIHLEIFRKRGGQYVRIDDPGTGEAGAFCPTVDGVLSILK